MSDDLDLREVARLLNVWSEHGWTCTDLEVLSVWVSESASRTRFPPKFEMAWNTVQELGLASPGESGLWVPSNELLGESHDDQVALDEVSDNCALSIFQRLMGHPDWAEMIDSVLSCMRFSRTNATFSWTEISADSRLEPGWVWLQQLGLLSNDGRVVAIDPRLLPYICDASRIQRSISQDELNERLLAQMELAVWAEEWVVRFEQGRLRAAGADDLAEGVYRISVDDVEAGFDILSYETSGAARRIEVKASAGPRRSFFISRNEIEKAQAYGEGYWLAWLGYSERLPNGPVDLAWFQNPAKLLDGDGPWRLEGTKFLVTRQKDDAEFETSP